MTMLSCEIQSPGTKNRCIGRATPETFYSGDAAKSNGGGFEEEDSLFAAHEGVLDLVKEPLLVGKRGRVKVLGKVFEQFLLLRVE